MWSDNLLTNTVNRDRGSGGGATGGAGAGAGAGAGGDELAALANSPVVQQLRQVRFASLPFIHDWHAQMVQENPALIQPLLQQIATTNPQLAQLINQNPQALYDLLGVGEADEGEYPEGAQVMQVNLTQDEAAAVERVRPLPVAPAARWRPQLEQLGFDRQMVLQAYMLCDKDEELAANFLFEAGEEDM
jgi:UV excision repair protein RAD23